MNGAPVHLLRRGEGPPLLYLHSAGVEGWRPFHDLLARHFDVILPFHPGYGGSERPVSIATVEDVATHYTALLDVLGLGRISVMGLSLGGWMAAELAVRSPERVARLVLVDAVGLPLNGFRPDFEYFQDPIATPGYLDDVRRRTFWDPSTEVAYAFVPKRVPGGQIPELLRSRETTARLARNPYFHNPKLPSRLHRITCPTLIVWGDSDGMVPLEIGRAYHAGIPGSRLLIMERCGHVPPIERPEQFAAEAIAFLAGNPSSRSGEDL